jgi:hypothetical protein
MLRLPTALQSAVCHAILHLLLQNWCTARVCVTQDCNILKQRSALYQQRSTNSQVTVMCSSGHLVPATGLVYHINLYLHTPCRVDMSRPTPPTVACTLYCKSSNALESYHTCRLTEQRCRRPQQPPRLQTFACTCIPVPCLPSRRPTSCRRRRLQASTASLSWSLLEKSQVRR